MATKPSLKSHQQHHPHHHHHHHHHPHHHQARHVAFDLPAKNHINKPLWGINQLIPAHPAITQIDETTLSLARTLAYLDGDAGIPKSLLLLLLLTSAGRRAPRRRWDGNGESEEISSSTEEMRLIMGSELVDVLQSGDRTEAAIGQLRVRGLLNVDLGRHHRNGGGYGHGPGGDVLRMDAGTRAMYKQSMLDPQRWMLQALLLVCHAFPVDAHLDVDFYNAGLACIVQFQHVITQHYDTLQAMNLLSSEMKQTVAYALIASSHFSSISWRLQAIDKAENIASSLRTPDECLNMIIQTRKTCLHLYHSSSPADALPDIPDFSSLSTKNKKLNTLSGELLLAHSTLCLQTDHEDIDTAFMLLQHIQPVDRDHISPLEELTLQKKALCWGRIRRYQGRFEESRQVLEAIYNSKEFPQGVISVGASSHDLISELAATYCELGDPVKAEMLISDKLQSISYDDENHFSMQRKTEDGVLRLRLALAEAVLQQGEYWRAEDIYCDINRHLCVTRGGHPDSIRSVCRLYIGFARVQHVHEEWVSALRYWERALRVYEKYPSVQDWGTVVVCASISDVKGKLGDVQGAALYADKARTLLGSVTSGRRRYWYTGLGSWGLDELMT